MTTGQILGNLETHRILLVKSRIHFLVPMGVREAVMGTSSTLHREQIPHRGLQWPRLFLFQEAPQR